MGRTHRRIVVPAWRIPVVLLDVDFTRETHTRCSVARTFAREEVPKQTDDTMPTIRWFLSRTRTRTRSRHAARCERWRRSEATASKCTAASSIRMAQTVARRGSTRMSTTRRRANPRPGRRMRVLKPCTAPARRTRTVPAWGKREGQNS